MTNSLEQPNANIAQIVENKITSDTITVISDPGPGHPQAVMISLSEYAELKAKAEAFSVIEEKFYDIAFVHVKEYGINHWYWEIETDKYVFKGKTLLEAITDYLNNLPKEGEKRGDE
jgi:hypothetical protein